MNFENFFRSAYKIVGLDEKTIKAVNDDKKAVNFSLLMILLFAVISVVGFMMFPRTVIPGLAFYEPDLLSGALMVLTTFLLAAGTYAAAGFLAEKVFNAKTKWDSYLKVLGLGQIVGFISIFPSLALVAWLWMLIIFLFMSRKVGKLDWGSIILLFAFTMLAFVLMITVLKFMHLPILDYSYGVKVFDYVDMF
ncbi:hypothetical protein KKC94_00120 [Patescibacteria group bacterium]|nr:hypothetical protein [Patescibacteria group bacterium]